MGRFKADKIIVRLLSEVAITFYDKETIYVFPKGCGNGTIFHRWFAPRGSYGNGWSQFRRQLLRQRHLDLARCHELADRYGILYVGTDKPPKLNPEDIKYRGYYNRDL